MNALHPDTVFSSIDRGGRYAYGNQPGIAQWNLARFAETLLPLLDPDPEAAVALATEVLEGFPARFEGYWLAGMREKLGLRRDDAGDAGLIRALLDWMQRSRADFTNTLRDLSAGKPPVEGRYQDGEFQAWHSRWRGRLGREGQPGAEALMRSVNPAVIPRNHRVEEALSAAEGRDDLSVLHRLLAVLASPYEERPGMAPYRDPPTDERGYRTFCGS
jgi:serine/tyrosine/threonine adenylyltransferase